jgi:ADP-ribosyl-[dinitrogen reductase] hydrolase
VSAIERQTDVYDRLAGTLVGTALGDALGLPAEGMSEGAIARRFGSLNRFRLIGATGFVSDDSELSALVAQSLARSPDDPNVCVRVFRRSLLGWFLRLPWGIGRATLRACVRIALGLSASAVRSAGNGAAMRAAVIGVFFRSQPDQRRTFGRALAEVTHSDPRAVEGALYVAELAAVCSTAAAELSLADCQQQARAVVTERQLANALDRAREFALQGEDSDTAAQLCGTSGFVVETLAFATFCFLRAAEDPFAALVTAVSAGGDTDSIGAILGGWLGARYGESGLPAALIARIHDGPFGPTHMRRLAACLASYRAGCPAEVPRYSHAAALVRNLALYPVILGHACRRCVPLERLFRSPAVRPPGGGR